VSKFPDPIDVLSFTTDSNGTRFVLQLNASDKLPSQQYAFDFSWDLAEELANLILGIRREIYHEGDH